MSVNMDMDMDIDMNTDTDMDTDTGTGTDLRDGIDDFCSYLRIRRSDNTVSAYRTDLTKFASHLERNGVHDWTEVKPKHIDQYILSLAGMKKATLSRKLASISSFYKFLIRQGYMLENPARDIEPIRISRRSPDYMQKEEIKVARAVSEHENLLGAVIVELLISTGVRVSELCSMNRDDIDLDNLTAVVVGKGDKQRTVFLSQRAGDLIQRYIAERPDSDNTLLYNEKKDERMNRFQVYNLVRRLGRRYLGRNLYPHLFRHTLATHSALGEMPLQELQEVLGHSNINTTMKYVHPSKYIREHHRKVIESLEVKESPSPNVDAEAEEE